MRIRIKKAALKDCGFFYRAHKEVDRKYYSTVNPVSFSKHKNWYKNNYRNLFVVCDRKNNPVGVIREQSSAILSIAILPEFQRKGYASESLKKHTENKNLKFVAVIHRDNRASKKCFSCAGFIREKFDVYFK